MNREELLKKFSEPIYFGNSGSYIKLIDVMGDDSAICDAARTSYGSGTKSVSENRDLIRYLLRNKHTSPIEMCEVKLLIFVPMDLWRQQIRHRTANVNEYSTRYSVAIDHTAQTCRDQWRLQSNNNKQGSAGTLLEWPDLSLEKLSEEFGPARAEDLMYEYEAEKAAGNEPGFYLSIREVEVQKQISEVYKERLLFGVAREQARKDLSLSTYTQAYWKMDLHNLLHFLRLRLDTHAQLEIRECAEAMAKVIQAWVPDTWSAFEDYVLNAMTFSAAELNAILGELIELGAIEALLNLDQSLRADILISYGLTSKTERIEFITKLKKLFEGGTRAAADRESNPVI